MDNSMIHAAIGVKTLGFALENSRGAVALMHVEINDRMCGLRSPRCQRLGLRARAATAASLNNRIRAVRRV